MAKNIFQKLYHKDLQKTYRGFTATGGDIILDNIIGDIPDLQTYFDNLRESISPKNKILISYHNSDWEPVLNLASKLGFRKKLEIQNWLDQKDLRNILELSGFEVINSYKRFFGITTITVAKPKNQITKTKHKEYSVSIIIPARNEEGNIAKIVPSIPKFGKWQEIIFVEGGSSDNTWAKITNEVERTQPSPLRRQSGYGASATRLRRVKAFKQKLKGKADAVKLGFENATGNILIIYDADRTVNASDLTKFYNALAPRRDAFINGNRLLYPMEKDAMQTLNKIANNLFGTIFTWILGQRFKDTLCGTKAMFRKDYLKYKKDYERYLKTDPFGDFALIFTVIKHNLKVIEIPIRYKERVYGTTNINRFRHGLLLAKMAIQAFFEFKI